jgi:hypothetical protein
VWVRVAWLWVLKLKVSHKSQASRALVIQFSSVGGGVAVGPEAGGTTEVAPPSASVFVLLYH